MASNSSTSARDGLVATGEATGRVWYANDMSSRTFHFPILILNTEYFYQLLTISYRQQPWCTYALHLATFTSLAFLIDPLLLLSLWWGTEEWDTVDRRKAFWCQFIFMFAFTKIIKLVGLFRRQPSDIMFLPLSILFGYFHGLIKLHALFTLNMVCLTLDLI